MMAVYTGKKVNKTESELLLQKYLKGAVEMTSKSSLLQAYAQINDWADQVPLEGLKKEDLDSRYKQLQAEKERYGFKQKAAYYANALAGDHGEEVILKTGAIFTLVSIASALPPEMFHATAALGAAYFGSKMAAHAVGDPAGNQEKMSARAYISIKHEQLALRQLAKRLKQADSFEQPPAKTAQASVLARHAAGKGR